jgi:hypothetical protein
MISALILPGTQAFFELPLLHLSAMAADRVNGRGASSYRQREKKESVGNHGFLFDHDWRPWHLFMARSMVRSDCATPAD